MKVTKLPRDPGPAAWSAILPELEPPTPVDGDMQADFLVIGAGFAGLAAARRLSLGAPKARIVVLDAVRVGEGPAGRNSGFMIDLPHDLASDNYGGALDKDRAQISANRAAIDFALETAEAFGLPDEAIQRSGKINAAASARGLTHNTDYARHLSALDEPYDIYDAETMRTITGIDYYRGGLYTPNAAIIQPAMFVRGLAGGLRSNRVHICEGSPVTALDADGTGWRAATPAGSVTAGKVVLAVNGHAESFGLFQGRLAHVFTYASMTRALAADEVNRLGGEPSWSATPADPMGTTVRRISGIGGDRIVVRNRFTYNPSMEVDRTRIDAVAHSHDRAFTARFPMLANVTMEYRWGGRLCLSRNDAPAFGETAPGLIAACCQNGLGTAKGTLAGMAAADLALGHDSDVLRFMSGTATPARLPPAPLAWLGATAKIRWAEYAAGREM
ncbi:MAG: NAD(P)/FAD-dependent oxidoreductase [Paracoccaceae bacterium]